jgi:hypothetical protein
MDEGGASRRGHGPSNLSQRGELHPGKSFMMIVIGLKQPYKNIGIF